MTENTREAAVETLARALYDDQRDRTAPWFRVWDELGPDSRRYWTLASQSGLAAIGYDTLTERAESAERKVAKLYVESGEIILKNDALTERIRELEAALDWSLHYTVHGVHGLGSGALYESELARYHAANLLTGKAGRTR